MDGGIGIHLQHLVSEEGDVWVGKLYLLELPIEIGFELNAFGGSIINRQTLLVSQQVEGEVVGGVEAIAAVYGVVDVAGDGSE